MAIHSNNQQPARYAAALCFAVLLTAAARPIHAVTINFESQCPSGAQPTGPCASLFSAAGNAQSLNVPTSIGTVNFQGGVLLDDVSFLPADETAVYGTAGNAADIGVSEGSGFTNPLTIIFPESITNFYLDVLNGNTMNVDYKLADNKGNSASFPLAPNLSGGLMPIGFAASGNVVTISALTGQSTPGGITWDFLIDNIHFDEPLPASGVPEPASMILIGAGLLVLGLAGRVRRKTFFALSLAALLAVLLLLPSISSAATTSSGPASPALTLSDNTGDSVTIDATGAASCTGYCITAGSASTPGNVTWAGKLGVFSINVAGGQSAPALTPAQLALELRVTTGAFGAGANNAVLNARWSEVGVTGSGFTTMTATSSLSGIVSVNYAGYLDSANALFGAGTEAGKIGPVTWSSSATVTGPGSPGQPFSMTAAVTAAMGPNSSFTLEGLNFGVGTAPLSVGCPSASGQLNLPYDSYLSAGGGNAPYVLSYTGTLPTGLGFNPSTGEINGTPTAAGTFSFTAQAVDTSGNPPQNTVQAQCSIAVTVPPAQLALACPATNNQEGVPYSSALAATGGTPPYAFFLTSGSLPPGLSLNPSTGAITGTDTAAAGTFPFTARAVDSSGNSPSNSAMKDCLMVAAAPAPKPVAACQLWYTTDDAKTFDIHWTFDEKATNAMLEELVPPDFAPRGTQGMIWNDLKTPGAQAVSPATGRSYNLSLMLNGARRVCNLKIELPACRIWARRVSGNRFNLGWTTVGTSANGMTFDPQITPSGPIWQGGSATINPTDETDYVLTVKGKVFKDSRNQNGDTLTVSSSCSTFVSPLLCTVSVSPKQVVASANAPATVNVTWDSKEAKQAVLQRLANSKPITPLKGDPPNPQNNPPKSQDLKVTQTTEFLLNVTSADSAKASCSACVLNRPEKGKVLDIPPLFQRNSMWCWLTVGEMIFKYRKPPVPAYDPWKPAGIRAPLADAGKLYQWGILAVVHPQCWLFPDACANVGGGSWKTLQDMLAKYPVAAGQQNNQKTGPIGCQQKPGCLSADEVKREIDAGRPIIAGITPGAIQPPATPAHVALIIGYVDKGNDIDLIVNDPWPYQVLKQTAPYAQFGGSQNCDSNYTIDRATFCAKAAWGGSLINIQ